jgi:hypothetical protein
LWFLFVTLLGEVLYSEWTCPQYTLSFCSSLWNSDQSSIHYISSHLLCFVGLSLSLSLSALSLYLKRISSSILASNCI